MTSPAQVSGPGPYSKRTDTGGQPIRELPDAKYGEAKEFRETQKAAPLAKAEGPPNPPSPSEIGGPGGGQAKGAPSPRTLPKLFDRGDPGIPITAGAPVGPGPNSIPGLPPGQGEEFNPTALRDAIMPYVAADASGILRETVYKLAERGLW